MVNFRSSIFRWLLPCLAGLFFAGGIVAVRHLRKPSLRIALVGDSTVSSYPATSPTHGWGEYLPEHFDQSVVISNFAHGGVSSRSFLESPRWSKALAFHPNYILVQFGHNDAASPDKPVATNATTEYPDFLRRYVREARAAGAVPILVTPMERRIFDGNGHLKPSLSPYALSMKQVAAELRVPLFDLHAASCQLFEKLGKSGTARLAAASDDATHFNEEGSRLLTEIILTNLLREFPELQKRIK